MSLKDRIKAKKEQRIADRKTEYNISISKVSKAISSTKDASDLGNIIREFAKFLNTLEPQNAKITFSGDFDLGQRTLLNCILGSFLEDELTNSQDSVESTDESTSESEILIRKRKSSKSQEEISDIIVE